MLVSKADITLSTWLSDHHRDLVAQAFAQRNKWHVTVVDGYREEPCQASVLHWGEYERIDWQLVHEGIATLT